MRESFSIAFSGMIEPKTTLSSKLWPQAYACMRSFFEAWNLPKHLSKNVLGNYTMHRLMHPMHKLGAEFDRCQVHDLECYAKAESSEGCWVILQSGFMGAQSELAISPILYKCIYVVKWVMGD